MKIKLGIIGAMDLEVETILGRMENKKNYVHAGSSFYEGTLENIPAVVVRCGVGKVNASVCAQILCSCFGVTHLVNTGIAGSLCADLDIGDLVVSQDVIHHDFDCCAVGYHRGQVPGMDVQAFPADETLMGLAFASAEQANPGHTRIGRVASGDQFICNQALKDSIIENTQAICTEMEGAAIGQVAYRNRIPFVILRAISDKADHSAEMDYPSFEKIAAHRCADVTCILARRLLESELS